MILVKHTVPDPIIAVLCLSSETQHHSPARADVQRAPARVRQQFAAGMMSTHVVTFAVDAGLKPFTHDGFGLLESWGKSVTAR